MGLQRLTERRREQIAGVLSCYDRPLIQGTLPGLCYAEGMTAYLYTHHVRIFDDAQWAQPLREAPRENAERLAQENGLQIEFIRRPKSFRKEDKIHQVLKEWGDYSGPVWIFSYRLTTVSRPATIFIPPQCASLSAQRPRASEFHPLRDDAGCAQWGFRHRRTHPEAPSTHRHVAPQAACQWRSKPLGFSPALH